MIGGGDSLLPHTSSAARRPCKSCPWLVRSRPCRPGACSARGEQRGPLDQVEIGARHAGEKVADDATDVGATGTLRMHERLLAAANVRQRHHDLAVERPPQQRGIEHVRPVGRRDHDYTGGAFGRAISTSSAFNVVRARRCRCRAPPRWRPTASISSMKMTRRCFFACSNISRTPRRLRRRTSRRSRN